MKNRPAIGSQIRILLRQNIKIARKTEQWGIVAIDRLREMTIRFGLSLALGDFTYLDGGLYVTHSGLLSLASRKRCLGIHVQQVHESCDPSSGRWVFKATVYKSPASRGFVGYGDAGPSNVSLLVRGAEMRVAETRAVNRALRKAYGIGLCSVEELGSLSDSLGPTRSHEQSTKPHPQNGLSNGQPRLRDRLCLLMSLFSFADAAIWEIKDSTRSRLAPLRVSVPQKSAAYALTRVGSRLYWRMVWSASSIPMLNQWR